MSDNQNKQTNECKCVGDKKFKALEKKLVELTKKVEILEYQLSILRKAVTK